MRSYSESAPAIHALPTVFHHLRFVALFMQSLAFHSLSKQIPWRNSNRHGEQAVMNRQSMKRQKGDGLLGQPKGIGHLILVEGWFNVAHYGVLALLVLYMTRQLLTPPHAAQVWGLAAVRGAFTHAYGSLSTVALASAIFGLYTSLIYVAPLAGAFLADRWLGRRRSILLGAGLLVLGDLLLVPAPTFLLALLCLIVGVGLFGGNLTPQIGEFYEADDPRRGDGFQMLYLAIDAGVIVAPLVCGTLGETWGYRYGFAAAALAMAVAAGFYLSARRWLPPEPLLRRQRKDAPAPVIGRQGWQTVAVLMLLIPVLGVAGVANNQIYGAYEIWGAAHYDLVFFGRHMPVTWLLSIDAFISFGCGFAVLALWRWLEAKGRLPSEIARCALGAFLSAAGALLLGGATWAAHGAKVGLPWGVGFHLVNNLGVAMLFPLTLALYSRAAPKGLAATMINSAKLNFFVSFQIVGWLGGFVDKLGGATFWLIHAALVAAAACVLLAFGRLFHRLLVPARAPADALPGQS
jgi:POT family proton-dependent oligopeptide transporter